MDWHWNVVIKCLLFSSFEIHHSTTTTQSKSSSRMWWSSQWWPSYWWKQEEAIRQYWILVSEMKKDFVNAPHWSIENGNQEKVSMLRESELSSSILVPSSTSRTIRKYNLALRDNVLLPEGFTEFIYYVGNGKELRSIVNHGLIPGGVSLRTGRQAVFFIIVISMDNQDAWVKPYATCHKQESRIQKYLETLSEHSILVQFEARSTKRIEFYQTRSNAVIFYDTLLVELFEKAICMKTKDQFFCDSKTSCCSLSQFAMWFTRSTCTRSKIIFGNRNKMRRATEKPEATLLITEYLVCRSQRWTCRMHGDKNNVTKLIEMFEKHQHKEQFL